MRRNGENEKTRMSLSRIFCCDVFKEEQFDVTTLIRWKPRGFSFQFPLTFDSRS